MDETARRRGERTIRNWWTRSDQCAFQIDAAPERSGHLSSDVDDGTWSGAQQMVSNEVWVTADGIWSGLRKETTEVRTYPCADLQDDCVNRGVDVDEEQRSRAAGPHLFV